MFDGKAFGEDLVSVVKLYVERTAAPLQAEIEALRKEIADLKAKAAEAPTQSVELPDFDPIIDAKVAKAIEAIPVPKDGRDGVSVTIEQVAPLVASEVERAISAIPAAKDGADGTCVTLADVAPMIAEQVAKAVSQIPPPRDGKDGADGKSLTIDEIEPVIERIVKMMPVPKDGRDGVDGRDGRDGADVDVAQVERLVTDQVSKVVSEIPKPVDGKDGRDGIDGKDGRDGVDGKSVELADIEPIIQERVSKAFEDMPKPRDGVDGKDGRDGVDGKSVSLEDLENVISDRVSKAVGEIPVPKDGRDGTDGKDGADGISVKEAIVDKDHNLVFTFSNGDTKAVGKVVGPAGKDGFSLDDFDAALLNDGRTIELSFTSGNIKQSIELAIPSIIYRGIWSEGKEYEQGDVVTWAGSTWHCNGGDLEGAWKGATKEKPGDGAKYWTLMAKRGRDGKDFRGPDNTPIGKVKI